MTVHELREQMEKIEDEWGLGNSQVVISPYESGEGQYSDICIGIDDNHVVHLEFRK